MSIWDFRMECWLANGKHREFSAKVEAGTFEEALDADGERPEDRLTESEKAMIERVTFDCRLIEP